MKGFPERYLNEIVSLTLMALLAIALIAGQGSALAAASTASMDAGIKRLAVTIEFENRLGRDD